MSVDISDTIDAVAAEALLTSAVNWKQYDGLRVAAHTTSAIYLVMWGELHWIPDPATFNSLFKDWSGIINSDYIVDNMPKGLALAAGSFIAISGASPAWYFVTLGKKLHIPDPATVNRFNFRSPISLPHLALDYIPTGPNVT
ncbi:hypothetical protein NHF48_005940 [Sphingomonas sp. H160509]|uniref:hypothetical protein n=1 Tax=Sphingomonas sp. H160509 TaxID=2955313 RepID=UPI00209727A4|nr:hypothetical protein [Sphingomonas sp. H160509]MDD1450626.1 hypothetical protein [Sphingomonas sp. H160509]